MDGRKCNQISSCERNWRLGFEPFCELIEWRTHIKLWFIYCLWCSLFSGIFGWLSRFYPFISFVFAHTDEYFRFQFVCFHSPHTDFGIYTVGTHNSITVYFWICKSMAASMTLRWKENGKWKATRSNRCNKWFR